jgi:hypothetical protein
MAITTVPSYPFDPTGTKATNKITGEQHILTIANPRDNYFLIPKVPPFFEDGLVVAYKDAVTGTPRALVKNIDYYCSHPFLEASYSTGKPIFGSLTILNTALAGIVTLGYNTVGGKWVPNNAQIAEALADRISNPRVTSWETIVNLPDSFPVIEHEYNLKDLKGVESLIVAVNNLTQTIAANSGATLTAHKADLGNPHQTTAAAVGAFTKAETVSKITEIVSAAIAAHVTAYHN